MQTFLSSRVHSYRSSAVAHSRAFTLVELLISISIIGIITALVLVKFSAFDSSVLLKSAAYEVALALRDAQVYSVSVHREGGSFDYPYGVHFVPDIDSYTFFQYRDISPTVVPVYNTNDGGKTAPLRTRTMDRSIKVVDVCVSTNGTNYDCNPSQLDISFRRPEFNALFYSSGFPGITKAQIKLQSTKVQGGDVWIVEVGLLGQISVFKQ